jgi:hypothetical protein
MRGGGFAVSADVAFAFRKTPDSKIFLERRGKEKTGGARGSIRLPVQAAGRECGRSPEYFFVKHET